MSRSLPVLILPQSEGGYVVQCPILSGCYSQGETVEEALANIREAIELVMEDTSGPSESEAGPPIVTLVTVSA